MTNPWKHIDEMRTKYVKDMEDAKAAAKNFKFSGVSCSSLLVWSARHAGRDETIRAKSAEELIQLMTLSHEAAEKKKNAPKAGP